MQLAYQRIKVYLLLIELVCHVGQSKVLENSFHRLDGMQLILVQRKHWSSSAFPERETGNTNARNENIKYNSVLVTATRSILWNENGNN